MCLIGPLSKQVGQKGFVEKIEAENAFMKERDKVQNNIAHHCSKCERKCSTVASMGNRILFVLRREFSQKYF